MKKTILALAVLLIVTPPLIAGVRIGVVSSKEGNFEFGIQDLNVGIKMPTDDGRVDHVVFHGGKKPPELVINDSESGGHFVINEAFVEQLTGMLGAAGVGGPGAGIMEQALRSMPEGPQKEEMRKRIEEQKRMQGGSSGVSGFEVHNTGEPYKGGKLDGVVWEISRNGRLLARAGVMPWSRFPYAETVRPALEGYADFVDDMAKKMPRSSDSMGDSPLTHIRKLGGMVVGAVTFNDAGERVEEWYIDDVHKQDLPDDYFAARGTRQDFLQPAPGAGPRKLDR